MKSVVYKRLLTVLLANVLGCVLYAQGNRLSITVTAPKVLTICGLTDTAAVTVYNISASSVTGLKITLDLPPGTRYIPGSVAGTGVSESNISNLNKPVFSGPNVSIAGNFRFRVRLTADCDLYSYLSSSGVAQVKVRADYTGNFDLGSSIPFTAKSPSMVIGSITNQSFTGNVGTQFVRQITLSNFGGGPLNTFRLVRVHGKDLKAKGVKNGTTVYSGDSVITIIKSADIKKIGDLDTLFEQNESIVITDTLVINGCKSLNTAFELSWGCNGKYCQVNKASGAAFISSQGPNMVMIPKPGWNTCYGAGNPSSQELWVTNNGQLDARGMKVAVYQPYNPEASRIDTGSILIKKGWKGTWQWIAKDSVAIANTAGAFSCLGNPSMRYFRLYLGDVKPKDTFYIKWTVSNCLLTACNSAYYMGGWIYEANCRDQCNNLKTIAPTTAQGASGSWMYASPAVIPTDMISGDKKEFRFNITSYTYLPLHSSAKVRLDFVLPPGLSHSLSSSDLYFVDANLTSFWYADSIRKIKDTIRAYYGKGFPVNLTNGELVFNLSASCAVSGANGVKTIQWQMSYMPNSQCGQKEWLYMTCQSVNVKIHCYNKCGGGMWFRNFNVQRSSYGLPDNDNNGLPDASGSVDMAKVRRERAMVGDTITSTFYGRVQRTSGTITWRFGYAESVVTYGNNLDVIGAEVEIYRGKTKVSNKCPGVRYKKIPSGSNATFKFDFSIDSIAVSTCISKSFQLATNDSVKLIVRYRVSKNIGGASVPMNFANRFYLGDVPNPGTSNSFQCDTFSGQMLLYGYYFTNWGPANYSFANCNQVWVNQYFYLGIGPCCSNYGGGNVFPYEYRNWAKLKAIRFYPPAGFSFVRAQMGQYRTSGSNATQFQLKDTIGLATGSNPLLFRTGRYYTDSGGAFVLSDDGFHGYFNALMQPSCAMAANTNLTMRYDMVFERKGALGKGFDTIPSGTASDIVLFQKPGFVLNAVSPTLYAAQDTAEWEVRLSNSSTTFNALNSWLYADNSGGVKVVEIRDAVNDTLLKKQGDIYKAGIVPLNGVRRYKVRATYSSCGKDSIVINAGWNCSGYPKDFSSYQCVTQQLKLFIEPQNTQFQLSLSDSTDTASLCTGIPYQLLLENVQQTNAYNTKVQLTLPIGMEVVPGTVRLKYPLKSAAASIGLPALVSGTTYEWDLGAYNSTLAKGFKGVGDTSRNKVFLSFRVKTNCDYSSGNYLRVSASGRIRCGDPVAVVPSVARPFNIKGVTRPYYTLVRIQADSVYPCQKPARMRVRVVYLGPARSGTEDRFQVILPKGMTYDSVSFTAYRNAPDPTKVKKRDINGATEVEWELPSGIWPGDSTDFAFSYQADGRWFGCGITDIYTQAVVKQDVLCVENNTKCRINVVTGNNLAKVNIFKSKLEFFNYSEKINKFSVDSEWLDIKYQLINRGNDIRSGLNTVVNYFYDKDGSANYSSGDVFLGSETFSNAIKKDSSVFKTRLLPVKLGYSCGLIAVLDSGSCSCDFRQIRFAAPRLINAGPDREICDGDSLFIGLPGGKNLRYQWMPSWPISADSVANPAFIYRNSNGQRDTFRMVLQTQRGLCSSRDTMQVFVNPLPQVKLAWKDTMICERRPVLLNATPGGGTGKLNVAWSPTGGISNPASAITLATVSDTSRYRIVITDAKGCKAFDSADIRTRPYPVARFVWPETCKGTAILLTDSSSAAGDSIGSNFWQWGAKDTLNSLQWRITPAGNSATVSLVSYTTFGCADTITQLIPLREVPTAHFGVSAICQGDSSRFVNQSAIAGNSTLKWRWELGNGDTSVVKNPVYLYKTAGNYPVRLDVYSVFGCRGSYTDTARIWHLPKAAFNPLPVCYGDSTELLSLSTISSDTIGLVKWTADGSQQFGGARVKLVFGRDSVHSVKLMVRSVKGCGDSTVKTVDVHTLPKASFSVGPVCEGDTSKWLNSSSIRRGSIVQYFWDFGDGNSGTQMKPLRVYGSGDTFKVELKVVSDKQCRDSVKGTAVVHPRVNPAGSAADVCLRNATQYTGSAGGTGVPAVWKWIFGPGDTLLGQNVSRTWPGFGNKPFVLKVITDRGCAYAGNGSSLVHPLPQVWFSVKNNCYDNNFDLKDSSRIASGSINTYGWKTGDGGIYSSSAVNHSYALPGMYRAVLSLVSDKGCGDSAIRVVQSYPPVVADFLSADVCDGDAMDFAENCDAGLVNIRTWDWNFGDGKTAQGSKVSHVYKDSGYYAVKLKISTNFNCSYDTVKQVRVYPRPDAFFSMDPDAGGTIVNPEILFTHQSAGYDSFLFNLGDGTYSKMQQFSHSYPDSGYFRVLLTAGNRYGCMDSFVRHVLIRYMFTLHVPTAFTPGNGDGLNPVFKPEGMGINRYSMQVFNRWGHLVFKTDKSEPWDAMYEGKPLPEGTYAVLIQVEDYKGRRHYWQGAISLVR